MIQVPPTGPTNAPLMIVGEAPGEFEERAGRPFCGASGLELDRMLHEAGIMRSEAFATYVCRYRPPKNDIDEWFNLKGAALKTTQCVSHKGAWVTQPIKDGAELLEKEISLVKPRVIIALGNVALWALTGHIGISSWRGSELKHHSGATVIPTFPPSSVLRQWSWRAASIHDLRRAANHLNGTAVQPRDWTFVLRPTFEQATLHLQDYLSRLTQGPLRISLDLETRAGHIACIGLGTSYTEAICIPLMCVERKEGYWLAEEEALLLHQIQRIICHPNAQIVGQNLLYDCQYIYRWWCCIPRVAQDTMVSHHVAFAGLPKALDYQASIYCQHYVYWKDDGKEWDRKTGEDQLWQYNCVDVVRTLECADTTRHICNSLGLTEPETFQHELFFAVLETMNRGVRVDTTRKLELSLLLEEEMEKRQWWFEQVLGYRLNPRSSTQMHALFHKDLGQRVILNRKTGQPSLDTKSLDLIAAREPLLGPIVRTIAEYRSLGVFKSTFIDAKLDWDNRLRCSYNICGTETYRFSSSKNAFGSGTNLQNIPKGSEDELDPNELRLPNVRRLFIPDPGFTFFDMDLDRADLQVVVWEAEDAELKAMLREGVDIHSENAKVLGISRAAAKAWVHGTNYGGGPRTMAINCGITVAEAERRRTRWFQAHPGINDWHARTEASLRSTHSVTNRFGYRRFYFDRIDGLLPEALAWIPQSTVACVINRAYVNIYKNLREAQILLQVHDSLAGQFPTHLKDWVIRRLKEEAEAVVIPYDDPLVIPVGIKVSDVSWGDCE